MPRTDFLEKMSLKDLIAFKQEVEAAIVKRREEEKAEMQAKMARMAEEAGFSIEELFGKPRGRRGGGIPKYRNPDNPNQTWSGRGRKPRWLEEKLAEGMELEEFLIR